MTEPVDYPARSARTAELIVHLHEVVFELEKLHPGRKFTPDGHLVGSIGEAAAEALVDLTLSTASTAGHDAVDSRGRTVEIKATYGGSAVMIRPTSERAAQHLIVMKLSKYPDTPHDVVYNGPLAPALEIAGPVQSNGQARLGMARLRLLDVDVRAEIEYRTVTVCALESIPRLPARLMARQCPCTGLSNSMRSRVAWWCPSTSR